MTDTNYLWIITEVEETIEVEVAPEGRRSSRDTGGGFGTPEVVEKVRTILNRERVPVDVKALKAHMAGMLMIVDDLFNQAETSSGLQLDEVELSVEINAEGQVSLVGNGGKLGNTGAIKLTFKRPE